MTTTTSTGAPSRRWAGLLLAALAAVLAFVLPVGTASASGVPAAQTRVGASHPAVVNIGGVAEHIAAGQRRSRAPSLLRLVSGHCVAAESGGFDLAAAEEAGGHTLARHVGMSDQALIERNIPYASTFTDQAAAESATAQNLSSNAGAIDKWLAGSSPRIAIQDSMDSGLGRLYERATQTFLQPNGVNTVLVRTPTGYNVLTSYPTP